MGLTDIIRGKDVVIQVDLGSGPRPVACATSCTLELTAELIPATDVTAGSWRGYIPGFKSGTVTGSGFTQLNVDVPWDALVSGLDQGTEFDVSFDIVPSVPGGVITSKSVSFKAFLTRLGTNASVGDLVKNDFTMTINGAITIT